jgi:hypothetical protein
MVVDVGLKSADAQNLLHRRLARQIDANALAWLNDKRERIVQGVPDHDFFAAFSAAPRHLGKQILRAAPEDAKAPIAERTGWDFWSVDQAGRTLLLLSLKRDDAEAFIVKLRKLVSSADLGELVALYQSLPLLPHAERLVDLAAEGARSNMTALFNAVALRNAYPAEYFDEGGWNQLVLKALFVGSPLHLVHGLDRRANPKLARMLVDYAHERWAAKRPVSPELWRPVGPYADDDIVVDLEKVLVDPDPNQQSAAALALSQSTSQRAMEALAARADLRAAIAERRLTWDALTRRQLAARQTE